jgi:hypothetical protein
MSAAALAAGLLDAAIFLADLLHDARELWRSLGAVIERFRRGNRGGAEA